MNGNLISKADDSDTTLYTWDYDNRLVAINSTLSTINHVYDGDGNRISKTTDGVKTNYINDVGLGLVQVLMETNEAGEVQASYTYGNDLISAHNWTLSTDHYYFYDGLGSVRQLTDDTETVVAEYTYDAFGNVIASSGTTTNTYGFTGEQQFGEADNLVFLRARYYDSSIGRFISRDPIGYWGGINIYGYCRNNPVNFMDPRGFFGIGPIPPIPIPPIPIPPKPPTPPKPPDGTDGTACEDNKPKPPIPSCDKALNTQRVAHIQNCCDDLCKADFAGVLKCREICYTSALTFIEKHYKR